MHVDFYESRTILCVCVCLCESGEIEQEALFNGLQVCLTAAATWLFSQLLLCPDMKNEADGLNASKFNEFRFPTIH